MLTSLMKSVLPRRFLYPQQRRYRDRLVALNGNPSPSRRLSLFLVGGLLLASAMLLTADALRATGTSPSQRDKVAAHHATDGRATFDSDHSLTGPTPTPIVTRLNTDCAAHARERLMTGLTHYYLQRRLRPGASSEDAADISSLTGTLAGPGDPAVMTVTESSCEV